MIVRPRPNAFSLLFILRGSILPMIAPRVLCVLAVSAGVVVWHHLAPASFRNVSAAPFTLLGLALSIFLGFRNNACYERWWEGRKEWGQLIAETRNLTREFLVLLPEDAALQRRGAHRIVAFAHALRNQLRASDDGKTLEWLPAAELAAVAGSHCQPDAIQRAQGAELSALLRSGKLGDIPYTVLAQRLQAMTNIQSACERLQTTPTPFTYTLLLHRTAWLFCLLLPFGLVGTVGLATPVLTAILAYSFFGLDALGEELEEPFGGTQNALPLDAMVRNIEIAVGEALGDATLPEPLKPKNFILN
ncbi:MAG: bestrophin family protein [Methylovirgula sp.]